MRTQVCTWCEQTRYLPFDLGEGFVCGVLSFCKFQTATWAAQFSTSIVSSTLEFRCTEVAMMSSHTPGLNHIESNLLVGGSWGRLSWSMQIDANCEPKAFHITKAHKRSRSGAIAYQQVGTQVSHHGAGKGTPKRHPPKAPKPESCKPRSRRGSRLRCAGRQLSGPREAIGKWV